MIKLSTIKPNSSNPRIIKDDKFKKLVQSLKDFPVMADKREVVLNEDHIILGGNMRYRAAKEAGWVEMPAKYFTRKDAERNNKLTGQTKTYEEYCDEFIVKDNLSGGEWDWDMVFNLYDPALLEEWGMDLPVDTEPPPDPDGLELEEKKELSVSFDDEASMQKLYDELSERGFKCRILTL